MKAWLYHYLWVDFGLPVWPNVGAMPVCGVLAAVFAFLFRDHIGRVLRTWWHRHFGHADELAEIRDLAARAHRIAADTHRHVTGRHHPDAPGGANEPETKTPT